MLVVDDNMANGMSTYLPVEKFDCSNSMQTIAVAAASRNPVDKAARNKALS